MKVDAKTADTLGWFTAIVKRPFHAEWSNYGMPDLATDYKAGEKIRCVAWKPEGMSPCKAAGHPDMWLSWKLLENCEYSAEDVARLERLNAENSRARNAKFKVGDVVSVKREAAVMIGNPALARKRGRVTKVKPGGYYEVDGDLGATGLELTDAELVAANSCGVRSTNAAVNAALNGCAKNAAFKLGDKVRIAGSAMQPSFGKEGRIVKIDKEYGDITIKADDGKTYTATESVVRKISNALNSCVAKNGIGDAFSDAVADCTDAIKLLKSGNLAEAKDCLYSAKDNAKTVAGYSWADANDKAAMRNGIRLVDAAIADPTEAKIAAARKELEKGRAKADGNSPRASFNACARNATKPASVLAAKWNAEAKELEDMIKKATPWRTEMKKMRARADQIKPGEWWELDENDPDAGKADAAYRRLDSARQAASNLWFSI